MALISPGIGVYALLGDMLQHKSPETHNLGGLNLLGSIAIRPGHGYGCATTSRQGVGVDIATAIVARFLILVALDRTIR